MATELMKCSGADTCVKMQGSYDVGKPSHLDAALYPRTFH